MTNQLANLESLVSKILQTHYDQIYKELLEYEKKLSEQVQLTQKGESQDAQVKKENS